MMDVQTNGFANKALLVSLSIRMWQSRKLDKKVTRETAERYGAATAKAGSYHRNLLPIEGENAYKAVQSAATRARDRFVEASLPWLDEDGTRIVSTTNYLKVADTLREDRAAFEAAVETFIADLPILIEKAKAALGPELFHEKEYPTPQTARERFVFKVRTFPLPDSHDFRAELADDEVTEIKAQIKEETRSAIHDAMHDLYERLEEQVATLHKALTNDGVVKDATMANLRSVCELLPKLNLTNDSGLVKMHEAVTALLDRYDAEDLSKKKPWRRAQAAKEVERISNDLAAFMGN
jgi:hypothetical protein